MVTSTYQQSTRGGDGSRVEGRYGFQGNFGRNGRITNPFLQQSQDDRITRLKSQLGLRHITNGQLLAHVQTHLREQMRQVEMAIRTNGYPSSHFPDLIVCRALIEHETGEQFSLFTAIAVNLPGDIAQKVQVAFRNFCKKNGNEYR